MIALSFSESCRQNPDLAKRAKADRDATRELWQACRGVEDGLTEDSYAEAAYETAPVRYAASLRLGGFAAAYAAECHGDNSLMGFTGVTARMKAREAWETFEVRAEKADAVAYGLGADDSVGWECTRVTNARTPSDVRSMARIAELAGRMYAILRGAKATKVEGTPEEIHDVELGSNLGRLLPTELCHLGLPSEILLTSALAGHRALQYKLRGEGEAGRGPLVLCLDESGSMHGTRRDWSKAAALALARFAGDADRAVTVVHFSKTRTVTSLAPGDAAAQIAMMEHWFGGGTRLGEALDEGLAQVEAMASRGDDGADLVMLTDGLDGMRSTLEAACERVAKSAVRLFTVAIECEIPTDHPLRAAASEFVKLDDESLDEDRITDLQAVVM